MFTELRQKIRQYSWFNDARLSERFGIIIEQIGHQLESSLPASAGNHEETQALYRFLNNEKVKESELYHSVSYACEAQLDELTGQTFRIIGDMTSLNYTKSKTRDELDCLDSVKQKGFFCQSLLLTDSKGCPESLLRQTFFNRKAEELGGSRQIKSTETSKVPIESKESYRWIEDLEYAQKLFGTQPQNQFVYLVDSEGDFFELFAARRYDHIHILTRSHHDRRLWNDPEKGTDQPKNLRLAVASMPCQGCVGISIRDDKTGQKRFAKLEIRYRKVTLNVPQALKTYQKDKNYQPIPLSVVEVREITPQSEALEPFEPLHWFLITTLPVENLEPALSVIRFYTLRWRVEDFHVVLKEGCKVEKLQFKREQPLKNALAIYSIVAVQHLRLRYLHDSQPDEPMQILGLPVRAYEVLAQYLAKVQKIKLPKVEKPTVAHFFRLLAWLATGNPKNIGFRALWTGIRKFNIIWGTFCAFNDG